jgi:hypothetical protein
MLVNRTQLFYYKKCWLIELNFLYNRLIVYIKIKIQTFKNPTFVYHPQLIEEF